MEEEKTEKAVIGCGLIGCLVTALVFGIPLAIMLWKWALR